MSFRDSMREELRLSLRSTLPEIPPKYFYDAAGSALFDRITELPEYYLTRTETSLLEANAADLTAHVRPDELVELGSGYSVKTRHLLDAVRASGSLRRYIPFDFSEPAMAESVRRVGARYPGVTIQGVIGDFERDLASLPEPRRRLIAFLGSTIGNLPPERTGAFLASIRRQLDAEGAFLLGVDLVKDRTVLEAAYNDAQGVTAAFNLNVLRVLNHELGASLSEDDFEHVAFYDEENHWIEMRLRARRKVSAHIPGLDAGLDAATEVAGVGGAPFLLELAEGAEIRTEISRKFTQPEVESLLTYAGLTLHSWVTDPARWFALALATPSSR